jgi:WD40 repeat protein
MAIVCRAEDGMGAQQLFTGSRDCSVILWDLATATVVAKNHIQRNVCTHARSFSAAAPTSDLLHCVAQTSEDRFLRLWDVRTLTVATTFPQQRHILSSCDVSPCGRYIATTSHGINGDGCYVDLWDVRQRSICCTYLGHSMSSTACAFVPDTEARQLVSVGNDGLVFLWAVDATAPLASLSVPHAGALTSVAIDSGGRHVAVGSISAGVLDIHLHHHEVLVGPVNVH